MKENEALFNHPFMTTERLLGFIPQLGCFEDYKNMMQDKTFIACYGVAFTEEQIYERLVDDINHWDKHGFGPLMWYDKQTHDYVGRAGIKTKILEGKEEVELAYAIIPRAWGKGLAMEMSYSSIDYAFTVLHLETLICFTQTKNSQSLAVMQKLGFHYEKEFDYLNLAHIVYRLQKR
jgi:RimJ/RimL family protein N-acetyltransferase